MGGEEIALLQTEALACVVELANMLFVRWVFISILFIVMLSLHERNNVKCMKSCRLRSTFVSSCDDFETSYKA